MFNTDIVHKHVRVVGLAGMQGSAEACELRLLEEERSGASDLLRNRDAVHTHSTAVWRDTMTVQPWLLACSCVPMYLCKKRIASSVTPQRGHMDARVRVRIHILRLQKEDASASAVRRRGQLQHG